MDLSLPYEAGPKKQLLWWYCLALNPNKVGNGRANRLGLGKTQQCAIAGKPSNCFHLSDVGLVSDSLFRGLRMDRILLLHLYWRE